jgi:hypothetical protein
MAPNVPQVHIFATCNMGFPPPETQQNYNPTPVPDSAAFCLLKYTIAAQKVSRTLLEQYVVFPI